MITKLITTTILAWAMWLVVPPVQAQSGPQIPCVGCESRQHRITPTEGMWYNPEQSGTGFMIDVRNQHIGGTWYGYDEQGQPTWLIFSGPLAESETPEVMWTVDADLVRYEGGNCANCPYRPPSGNEIVGNIQLEFYQMNHASVRINGGERQFVVPVTFGGIPRIRIGESPYTVPDVHGQWLFVFKRADDGLGLGLENGVWNYGNIVVDVTHLSETNIMPDRPYVASIEFMYHPADILVLSEFTCYRANETTPPYCEMRWPAFDQTPEHPGDTYRISLGNMGEDRIFGESPEGHYFIAYKLGNTTSLEIPQE